MQQQAIAAGWMAGHDRLARASTAGANHVVSNRGHYIQLDQPDAVVDAVRGVVARLRSQD